METTDVCVIGAGPVGLTLAGLVAAAGLRVTVVESSTVPGDLPRAISIVDETFRIIDALGLADALKAESNLDTWSRYFGLGGALLAASKPAASRMGHPAKSQFDQPVLERVLWEHALADDRIRFLRGATLTGVEQDTGGVTVTLEGEGAPDTLRADWLAGCDGGRSTVRKLLGIELVGSTQVEKWIVVDLEDVPGTFEKYADFHCNAERPVVVVPGIKGRLRFEFMLLPGDDEAEVTGFASIRELVRPFAEIRESQVRRSSVYVAHQRLAATYRKGRAFLAGDAAHLMPPFAGQGLNAGLRDAANLAWKLIEAVRGRATQALLDTYESERRPNAAAMVKISHRIGQVVMTTDRRRARARDLAFRALSIVPSVRAYLAGMRFITPPDYAADGCAVAPGREVDPRLARLVGRAMPQPTVRTAADDGLGLDALLRGGWSLLAIDPGVGIDPYASLDPRWRGLVRNRVVVHDAAARIAPDAFGDGTVEVADRSGYLAEADAPLDEVHYLLVRPDLYAAAVFTRGSEPQALAGIARFVAIDGPVDATL